MGGSTERQHRLLLRARRGCQSACPAPGQWGREAGAGIQVSGGGRGAGGFVRAGPHRRTRSACGRSVVLPSPRWWLLRDGAPQGTLEDLQRQSGRGFRMWDSDAAQRVPGMRTLGVTRTPGMAYEVFPRLGILSCCYGAEPMVSPAREPARCLAGRADPKLLCATLGVTGLFAEPFGERAF